MNYVRWHLRAQVGSYCQEALKMNIYKCDFLLKYAQNISHAHQEQQRKYTRLVACAAQFLWEASLGPTTSYTFEFPGREISRRRGVMWREQAATLSQQLSSAFKAQHCFHFSN